MDKSGVRSVIDRTLGPRGTLLAFSYGDIFASLLGCYLTGGDCIDLDFDHQFIPAGKKDAEYSYKNAFGYFPGVASVGGLIVGIENRDGNTNVKFHQKANTDTSDRIITYGICSFCHHQKFFVTSGIFCNLAETRSMYGRHTSDMRSIR